MCSIRSLNPKSDVFLNDATLLEFGRLYHANIDDLGHELHQLKRLLVRKIYSDVIQKRSDTVESNRFTEPYKDVVYELFRNSCGAPSEFRHLWAEFLHIKSSKNLPLVHRFWWAS